MYKKITYLAITALLFITASKAICADFIRGADISIQTRQDEDGVVYREYGVAKDAVVILKNHDLNWIRIRIFHNPDNSSWYGVCQDLDYVTALATRVKAQGFKFLLDFHYSDDWADPGSQDIPAAWTGYSHSQLVTAVHDYTRDVITHLRNNGVMPEMVQIGNEVIGGMLWPDGQLYGGASSWSNFADLINAGISGVNDGRGAETMPEIMIHIDRGGDAASTEWFFDNLLSYGVQFDVIGQSYYPEWHGTLDDVQDCLDLMAANYTQDIVYAEVGDFYTGTTSQTPESQKAIIEGVIERLEAMPNGQGRGLFYWEPTWVYQENTVARRALFEPILGNQKNVEMLIGMEAFDVNSEDITPNAPTGLSATGYNGSVGLDWDDNSESDLDGYNIYRSTTSGSGYSKLNSSLLSNSNYTDDSVTNNTTYYYVVTAVDVNENESGYSSQASATPQDTDAPATPTGLTAAAGDQIVLLGWNANSEGDLAGYNIYRSTTSGSGYIKLNSSLLSSPDYSDSSVSNATTYYYVVTAVDTSSNESANSSEVSAIPTIYGDFIVNGIVETDDLGYLCDLWLVDDCEATQGVDLDDDCMVNFYEFAAFAANWMIIPPDTTAPAAPTGLSATAGDGTVSLNWNDNGEGDLAGYNIYRSTTSGSGYSKLNGSLLSTSDYTDNSVANGTTYYYVVTAVDISSNESAYSGQVSATPAAPVTSITIQENDAGFCDVDGSIDNNNDGYTGDGFANTDNASGNGVDWSINVLTAGTYTFTWRYANGGSADRPGNLIINSSTAASGVSFPVTGNWTTWTTVSTNVSLTTGVKSVRLEATSGDGLGNIDYVEITGPNLTTAACQ